MGKTLTGIALVVAGILSASAAQIEKNATTADILQAIADEEAGGTITFPAGTWTLDSTLVLDKGITIEGAGPNATTLDFNNACRGFAISNANATVKSLRIYQAKAETSGGGVFMTAGLVTDCKIDSCHCGYWKDQLGGGGILMFGGSVVNCEFDKCRCDHYYAIGNSICMTAGTVSGCDIHGQTGKDMHDNIEYTGGAVMMKGGVLENSRIHDNTNWTVPGVYLFNGSPIVRNCLIYNNSGKYGSAGIFMRNDKFTHNNATVAYCTVFGNTIEGDTTGCSGLACNDACTVKNSIFYHNGTAGVASVTNVATITHNVFESELAGFAGNIVGDPLFLNGDNGGCQISSTDSPAYGAAEPMADVTTDISGYARSATAPTCGAFEYRPTLIDTPAATASATRQMIQQALDAAALSPAGLVELGEGTFEIDQQLLLNNGVTLKGQGRGKTTISQVTKTATVARCRCAVVDGGSKLFGLTLTGGYLSDHVDVGEYGDVDGACVKLIDGQVSYCRLMNNTNAAKRGGGGAISLKAGRGTIDHCEIVNNNTTSSYNDGGAGIHIKKPTGPILIDTCLISGNRVVCANNFPGGGGICGNMQEASYVVTIRNSTIVENRSENSNGGGLYLQQYSGQHSIGCYALINNVIADNYSGVGDMNLCTTSIPENNLTTINSQSFNNLFANGTPVLGANSQSIAGSGVDAGWFVDPDLNDYHLSGTAPACAAGYAYEGLGLDLDGNEFDLTTPSIGCYEATDAAEMPVFEPASETTFYPSVEVTLTSSTSGARIYYTLDGTIPTDSSSLYSGPFTLSAKQTTVKARAYASGKGPSKIATATFYQVKPMPSVEAFKKSVTITLNTALASVDVAGLPALVRLSESSIDGFSYADFDLENGGDMMFVDSTGKALPHEVDTWNESGESLVWVKLPSSAVNTAITLYYGNGESTSADAVDVWSDYIGVWHLNEATAPVEEISIGTYANSTVNEGLDGNLAMTSITNESGKIGKSFRVNDSTAKQAGNFNYGGVWVNDAGTDSPLDCGENFTISGWFKHGEFGYYYDHFFYKRERSDNGAGTSGLVNAFAIEAGNGGNNPQISPRGSSDKYGKLYEAPLGAMIGVWEYITFVYDGTTCYVYSNGELKGSGAVAACKDNNAPITFGNNCLIATAADGKGDAAWNGWIDEVRYLKGSKSADWVAAEYAAMNVGASDVFTYGAVEDVSPTEVKTPVISPSDETFTDPVEVTITCATPGARIYYTTDGSTPTAESTEYTAPFSVSGTEDVTVKAIAFWGDLPASEVSAKTYAYEPPPPPPAGLLIFFK